MISLKELQYVDVWARKAPYPGSIYAFETLEKMKELFDKYNKNYREKNYSIIFSDSEELAFKISDTSVCHMLGIDFKNLINGPFEKFLSEVLNINVNDRITSYEVLKAILDNYEEVVKYEENGNLRAINYYKSRIKCSIFDKISEFEKFNFAKLETSDDSKLLFTPSNEAVCPYFFISLNRDQNAVSYDISSLLAPKQNELPSFFEKKFTIPTQIIIDDSQNLDKLTASPREKINLLNMYKQIVLNYHIEGNIDISGDYLSMLSELDIKGRSKTL